MSRGDSWSRGRMPCLSIMRFRQASLFWEYACRASRCCERANPSLSSWDAMLGSALAMSMSSMRWQVSSVRTSRGHPPREAVACVPGPKAATVILVCCAMCLPTPAGWRYRVLVVPRCSSHLAPALNVCSVLCPSAVLLRAAISLSSSGQLWLSPRCEAACRRCESLLPRRCSLRLSLSRAASRLVRLMISGRSRELAPLCAGSLKGNVVVVGGAGAGRGPTWFSFLPGVSCAKPIARCGPGEAGLSGEW